MEISVYKYVQYLTSPIGNHTVFPWPQVVIGYHGSPSESNYYIFSYVTPETGFKIFFSPHLFGSSYWANDSLINQLNPMIHLLLQKIHLIFNQHAKTFVSL